MLYRQYLPINTEKEVMQKKSFNSTARYANKIVCFNQIFNQKKNQFLLIISQKTRKKGGKIKISFIFFFAVKILMKKKTNEISLKYENNTEFYVLVEILENFFWYHGRLGKKITCELLEQNGQFLVRSARSKLDLVGFLVLFFLVKFSIFLMENFMMRREKRKKKRRNNWETFK